MSVPEIINDAFVDLLEDDNFDGEVGESNGHSFHDSQAPVHFSLANAAGDEQRYKIDNLQKLSEYLNREASSRYQAIILTGRKVMTPLTSAFGASSSSASRWLYPA